MEPFASRTHDNVFLLDRSTGNRTLRRKSQFLGDFPTSTPIKELKDVEAFIQTASDQLKFFPR